MKDTASRFGLVWFICWLVAVITARICEGGPFENITELIHFTVLMILGVPVNLALGIGGLWAVFWGIPLETWESLRDHIAVPLWKRVLQALGMFVLYNAIAIFFIFGAWWVTVEFGPMYIGMWKKVL